MRFLFVFLLTLTVSLLNPFYFPGGAFAGVQDVQSRGQTTRLLVEKGDNPFAVVVLFAGGKGVLKITEDGGMGWGRGNFLVRTAKHFRKNGAITAVIDAPSDRPYDMYYFRSTEEHAKDVGAVIKRLRAEYSLPVWLIGTSRGTNSVANAGARLQGADRPDGIVLTATVTEPGNKDYDHVMMMALDKIELPVLIAHHRKDRCYVTSPGEVKGLKEALKNANPVKVLWYEGAKNPRGNECGARHYHGFIGIEKRVVKDIMAWIRNPAP